MARKYGEVLDKSKHFSNKVAFCLYAKGNLFQAKVFPMLMWFCEMSRSGHSVTTAITAIINKETQTNKLNSNNKKL